MGLLREKSGFPWMEPIRGKSCGFRGRVHLGETLGVLDGVYAGESLVVFKG